MATIAELQTRRSEAEAARHRLMTGSMVEETTGPDGTKVKFFGPGALEKLNSYIDQIDAEIRTAQTGRRSRPIFFHF